MYTVEYQSTADIQQSIVDMSIYATEIIRITDKLMSPPEDNVATCPLQALQCIMDLSLRCGQLLSTADHSRDSRIRQIETCMLDIFNTAFDASKYDLTIYQTSAISRIARIACVCLAIDHGMS
jgi:hypothetical protein